jgi:heme-degrading monooxygenase HmoA
MDSGWYAVAFGEERLLIARIWHGVTELSHSDEYLNRMRSIAIPDYRAIPGNAGAYALRSIEGDRAHFLMLTFWESRDAIVRFAGQDIERAKYYDFDKDFLLELEPNVKHYELFDR